MILYLEDWDKYPTAIPDVRTTNQSWVRLAGVFKSMGIKNYCFHLALLNPALQGIDPHSPNLTLDEKTAIALECRFNPWYFFREVCLIDSGSNPLRFAANRPNIALLWCFFSTIDFVLIMPRQIGKSITGDMLGIWLTYLYYENTALTILTKDDELRSKTVRRIKQALNLLPAWLIPRSKNDADNTEVIECKKRNNLMTFLVGQRDIFGANKVGRGITGPYLQTEEGPFISNVHISLPVAAQSTGAARENFEKDGTLYGNIYTTTAGKKDTKEGKYMYDFINSGYYWNETLYDRKNKADAKEFIITNSNGGRCLVNGTFSHRQAGKTDAWLKGRLSIVPLTREEIERDYLNRWTSGNTSGALPTHILEIVNKSELDPLFVSVSGERYMMRWYIPEEEILSRMNTGHYLLGLDSSEAVGRDSNALVLLDVKTLEVIATSSINEASLSRYAKWIADFLIKFKKVTFIFEAKSSARGGMVDMISAMLTNEGIDPFVRMYSKIVDQKETMQEEYKEICKPLMSRSEYDYAIMKKYLGFMTTGNSRLFLYNTVLNEAVNSTAHLIRDQRLSSELKGLEIKNGRIDHPKDGHDDMVIAWLLCHWFIKHTKHLQHYGINPLECLSMVASDGATMTDEEMNNKLKVVEINKEINKLKDCLSQSTSAIESTRYEKMLAWKVREAQQLGDTAISLDNILKDIETSKRHVNKLRASLNKMKLNRNMMGNMRASNYY